MSLYPAFNIAPKLFVGIVYRSPSSSADNNAKFNRTVEGIYQHCNFTHLLLMGDFNYPQIDWCTSTVPGGDNSPAVVFLDSCEHVYLFQHVQNVRDPGIANNHHYLT